jgi:CRP-like cAMP-binding protein
MLKELIITLKKYESDLNSYNALFKEISIGSKTRLIEEGDTIKNLYFIKKGCLRLWFNNQGNDITYQFFFEDQVVSGFLDGDKSMFILESLKPSTIVIIKKSDFENLLKEIPELKDRYLEFIIQRLANYSRLFLSRIKDTPKVRYNQLVKDNPEILQRVPQRYIASYLGITSVSLSRIRNKKNQD